MQKLHNKFLKQFYLIPVNRKFAAMLAFFVVLSISAFAFSQNNTPAWKLNASINNVDFYYSISVCNGKQVVFLRFVNKNTKAATITFKEALKTSAGTEEASIEGKKKIVIQPGETFAQSCSENNCNDCMLLPERAVPTHKINVQDFVFKEIKITF